MLKFWNIAKLQPAFQVSHDRARTAQTPVEKRNRLNNEKIFVQLHKLDFKNLTPSSIFGLLS